MSHTSPSKSLLQPAPVVTSWTELQIPLSRTIEDEKSEDGKKWLLLTTHHNPTKTPGFRNACFGRVKESPDKVLYITAWELETHLDEFERSEDYRLQHEEYRKISTSPLKTHRCDIQSFFWQHLSENIGFMDVYFPSSISSETKQRVNEARGLVYHYAPGGSRPSAYVSRPTRGWVHGTREYKGQDAVVLRFMYFWKSEESERKFKAEAGITVNSGGKARYLTLYEHLMETLREAECLGVEEFHCRLVRVQNYWRDPDEEDEDEEYAV